MTSRRSLLALPFLAACGKSGSGYHGSAWVATQGSHSVAVVDLLAFTVRQRIDLASGPSALVRGVNSLYALQPESSAIAELDTGERKVRRTIHLPGPPLSARVEAGGERLWVLTAEPSPALIPVTTSDGRPGRPIALAGRPAAMAIAPGSGEAAVTLALGAVQFVDLRAMKASEPVLLSEPAAETLPEAEAATTDAQAGEVRYRSDGKVALVADRARRAITVVDTGSRRIMTQLPLAVSPDHLSMKDDGGQLFVTGAGRDAVVIVYTYRTEIAQTSLSGRRPGRMASASDPPYLFVSNPEAGSVTVFDITTQKVVAVTGVGVRPGTIAVTPDQQYALVLNEASGDMAVIRIAAITPGRAKRAPLFTMIPVGDKPVDMRVVPA